MRPPYPSASGSVKVKRLPWPSLLSAQMRPPCSSIRWRVMARPRPVPAAVGAGAPLLRVGALVGVAVRLTVGARHGLSERAGGTAGARAVSFEEALEDARQVFLADAGAVVADRGGQHAAHDALMLAGGAGEDRRLLLDLRDGDAHPAARIGEFQAVVNQVHQRLADALAVTERVGQVAGRDSLQRHAPLDGQRTHALDGRLHQRREVGRLQPQLDLARLDAREVQQLGDHL